jgi:uncharacterized protein (UPF0335 family)
LPLAKDLVKDSKRIWLAVNSRHMDIEVNDLCTDDQLQMFNKRLKKLEAEKSRLITLFGRSEIITVEELEEKVGEIKAAISEVAG